MKKKEEMEKVRQLDKKNYEELDNQRGRNGESQMFRKEKMEKVREVEKNEFEKEREGLNLLNQLDDKMKEERAKAILLGIKIGQGKTEIKNNPYKLETMEQKFNPNDPNRTQEEQKRLRQNWFQKQSYRRRTAKKREIKARIEEEAEKKAIEMLAREKLKSKVKELKEKGKDGKKESFTTQT